MKFRAGQTRSDAEDDRFEVAIDQQVITEFQRLGAVFPRTVAQIRLASDARGKLVGGEIEHDRHGDPKHRRRRHEQFGAGPAADKPDHDKQNDRGERDGGMTRPRQDDEAQPPRRRRGEQRSLPSCRLDLELDDPAQFGHPEQYPWRQ